MKNGHDFRDYIKDIYDSISDIETFIEGVDFKEFIIDKKTTNAVIRSIEVIGEATKKIPKAFKDKHKNIPWKKMAGMRDKLIHEYFGVDMEILWKVSSEEIPNIKPFFKNILKIIIKK